MFRFIWTFRSDTNMKYYIAIVLVDHKRKHNVYEVFMLDG